jgi:aminoglycoside phosphotransferase (APT) family kinase protein
MLDDEQHRAAAATWLGTVHVFARRIEAAQGLPDRGLACYLDNLQTARELIRGRLDHARRAPAGTEALQSILAYADHLERCWGRLERLCDTLPMTLVHGDFAAKNIRLRVNHDGFTILPFDWEWSGWGTPVVDLAQSSLGSTPFSADPDLVTYWTVVHGELPRLQAQTVERLAQAGTVLRLLNAIYWAALGLSHGWVQRLVRNLTIYEARLADAVRVLNSVL